MISFSEIESNRFGLKIYRGKFDNFETTELCNLVERNDFDIIIVRFPTNTICEHYRLLLLPGCQVIHADSLLYYKAKLQEINIHPLRNSLVFEEVRDNIDELERVVHSIFIGYQNHYFSNPYLQREKIIEGYFDWAKSYSGISNGKVAWFAKDSNSGVIKAFITCAYDFDEGLSDLILGGVLPQYAGEGIYTDLVRYAQSYFKEMGLNILQTSTQLQNYKVQKTWNKEGFVIDNTWETYHIVNLNHLKKCNGTTILSP